MKKNGVLLILAVVAVMLVFSGREKVSASIGPGEISWIECYNLPEGYVASGKADNTSAPKKRISAFTLAPEDTMKVYLTSKYEYDENGMVKFDPSTGDSVGDADAYYYDESGRLIRSEGNVGGKSISWVEYYYDANGDLEKKMYYNIDGYLATETFEIKDGRMISSHKVYDGVYYYMMGAHEWFSDYTYDRNGNLTKYAINWTNKNSGEEEGSVRTLTYDKYDRLIASSFSYNGGKAELERYEYDEEGYLSKVYKNELCISYLLENIEPEETGKAEGKPVKQAISVKKKTLTFSTTKLEKKQQSAKIGVKAEGSINCKKISGDDSISVTKTGKVKVKPGTPAGSYKIKIRITAAATGDYKKTKKTQTITIVVK